MSAETKHAVAETDPPLHGNEPQPAPDFPPRRIDQEAMKRLHAEIEIEARQRVEAERRAAAEKAVTQPEPKPEGSAQTIREFLNSDPITKALSAHTIEACQKHGISLDNPWPPKFPEEAEPMQKPESAPTAKLIHLDFWEDGRRAAPNIVFRSMLFPALNPKQERRYLDQERIFTTKGGEVFFTGKQFDQSDLDVYLEILQFARPFPLGTPVKFSAYSILKALGRNTGKSDHQWLHAVLIRLRSGTVDMADHKKRYVGGLIHGFIKDEITAHYEITIDPRFAVLFGYGLWSTLDKAQRQALKRNQTAKALHAYYSTHAAPGSHDYETLAEIIGLKGKNRRDVKATIIKGHEAMKQIGFMPDYEAGATSITAKINHTSGQNHHIARKIIRNRKAKRGTG